MVNELYLGLTSEMSEDNVRSMLNNDRWLPLLMSARIRIAIRLRQCLSMYPSWPWGIRMADEDVETIRETGLDIGYWSFRSGVDADMSPCTWHSGFAVLTSNTSGVEKIWPHLMRSLLDIPFST